MIPPRKGLAVLGVASQVILAVLLGAGAFAVAKLVALAWDAKTSRSRHVELSCCPCARDGGL